MAARKSGEPRWTGLLRRHQAVLGLAVAMGGAALIWRLSARWAPAWPLGFLLTAAGLYLMRTARDEED